MLYSGGPYPLKYIGLGEIAVFIIWGPLMIGGTYYVMAEELPLWVALASFPYGLGVSSVLFGKHLDKLAFDKEKGIRTMPIVLGEGLARQVTAALSVLMYASTAALAVWQEMWALVLVLGALPLLAVDPHLRRAEAGGAAGTISRLAALVCRHGLHSQPPLRVVVCDGVGAAAAGRKRPLDGSAQSRSRRPAPLVLGEPRDERVAIRGLAASYPIVMPSLELEQVIGGDAFAGIGRPSGFYPSPDGLMIAVAGSFNGYFWPGRSLNTSRSFLHRVAVYSSETLELIALIDAGMFDVNHVAWHPTQSIVSISCGNYDGGYTLRAN